MRHRALTRLATALHHLSALRTLPVRGAALDALCSQLESLVFLTRTGAKDQHKARAHLPERRAEALSVLQRHRPVPKTLLQIQRLHRLRLALGQTRAAACLLAQHGQALCQSQKDASACAQIRIHLHLLEADRLHAVDRPAGLQALRAAAEEIRALPATLAVVPCLDPQWHGTQRHPWPCGLWQDWQHRAERLYHDWPLAQRGCDWRLEQALALWPSGAWRDCLEYSPGETRLTWAWHHPGWQRTRASLEKARIVWRQHTWLSAHTPQDGSGLHAATEGCRAHLHAAIHHLEQMEYDPRSDQALSLWWRLLNAMERDGEPPLRQCVHAALQAAGRNLARMEPHILADLLPWAHEEPSLIQALHAARQVAQTFTQVGLAQSGFLDSLRHDDGANPQEMARAGWRAFGHAPGQGWESPEPFLNFMGEGALHMALLHALDPSSRAQVAACALAWHLHPGQTAQGRLHSALILLHACCDSSRSFWLRRSLRRRRVPLPDQAAAGTYLHAAREVEPDEPLIDLVLGLNAKDGAEALEHLERATQQIPQIFSGHALKSLWKARFKLLGQEAALARPWPLSGAASSNRACAEYLGQNLNGSALHPIVGHYLQAALDSTERFCADWMRDHDSPSPLVHTGHPMWPEQYSRLCRHLAMLRCRQKRWPEAQTLYARGLASRRDIHAHASGLLRCAQALGQGADAARWRRQIAALPTRDLEY